MSNSLLHTISLHSQQTFGGVGVPDKKVDQEPISKNNITPQEASSTVTLSQEAKELSNQTRLPDNTMKETQETAEQETTENGFADSDQEDDVDSETNKDSPSQLTEAEQQQVAELKARDQEVRTHEQAHAAIGGQYAGSPSYTYEQGPDGARYAVEGEVPIDVSPVANDPQATIQKMQQVYQAALAPAEPSSTDRKVAAEAQSTIAKATAELATSANDATITPKSQDMETENNRRPLKSGSETVDLSKNYTVQSNPYAIARNDLGTVISNRV